MASVFNRAVSTSLTAEVAVYTVPAGATAVVIGVNVANGHSAAVTSTVKAAGAAVVKDAPIPVGSALAALEGKIVLLAGDTVSVSATGPVDAIVSVLEQTNG